MKSFLIWLAAASSPLFAGVTVLTDGDFQPANWTTVAFIQTNATGMNSRVETGGNPDAYRQMTIDIPAPPGGASILVNIASFGSLLTYDPSVSGAIQLLEFSYDISRVSSTGLAPTLPTGIYRPFLEQDGKLFFLMMDGLGSIQAWTPIYNITSLASSWSQINGGVEKPDFSSNGGVITFGYRVLFSVTCPLAATFGCNAATGVSGIDNFTVRVTSADPIGNVPEPSVGAFVGMGVIAATLWRKRRLGPRSSR